MNTKYLLSIACIYITRTASVLLLIHGTVVAGVWNILTDSSSVSLNLQVEFKCEQKPQQSGTIRGQIMWQGPQPDVGLLAAPIPGPNGYTAQERKNPHQPVIGPNGGLSDIVVTIESNTLNNIMSWPHEKFIIEHIDYSFRLLTPSGKQRHVGFVPIGAEVEFVSRDPTASSIRLRGAAYATLPFPDANQPLTRRLDKPGLIELSSGSMYYWMAKDLYVCEHPFWTTTDSSGKYELQNVPPGSYVLVMRIRNWHITGIDRDPESGLTYRQRYAPIIEKRFPITVTENGTSVQDLFLRLVDFPTR